MLGCDSDDRPIDETYAAKRLSELAPNRCTSATVLQTYQMVALHALLSSYHNTVLYVMRVRYDA